MAGLNFPVRADTTQFDQAMDRARSNTSTATRYISQQFDDMSSAIERSSQNAGNALSLIISGGIVAAAAGLTSHLSTVLNALSNIGDRAQDLRLPVNMLQGLSVAADQARVPAEGLNKALDQFTRVSKQDTETGEQFYKALGNIGQGFVEAFKTAPTQADRLGILSNALRSTTDEVKKAQLGLTAFGTDNERILSLFDKGQAGLNGYIEQLRRLGLMVDETLVQRAQEARSQISLLSRVLGDDLSSGIGKVIPYLVRMLPYLEAVGRAVVSTLGAISSAIDEDQDKTADVLRKEMQTIQRNITDLEAEREGITSGKPSLGRAATSRIREQLGLGDDSLDDLDAAIARLKVELDKKNDLVREKEKQPGTRLTVTPGDAFKPRPSLTAGNDDTDAFDKSADAINRHIAALRADNAAVGLTAAAHEQLRVELRLLQAAAQEDDDITDKQIAHYAELRSTMSAQQALQATGIDLGKEHARTFLLLSGNIRIAAGALDDSKRAFQGVNEAVRFGGNELINVIDRATQKGADFGQIMSDVFRNIAKQALQAALTGEGAFAKLFGTASTNNGVGGLGGLIAGLFGSGASNPVVPGATNLVGIAGSTPIPTFAEGGTIGAGGLAYVGEHGPNPRLLRAGSEPIMVTPGDVAPRSSSGGASVHMPISIDARGAQAGVAEQIEMAMRRTLAQVPKVISDMQRYNSRALRQ
jgi:hypothetical protein